MDRRTKIKSLQYKINLIRWYALRVKQNNIWTTLFLETWSLALYYSRQHMAWSVQSKLISIRPNNKSKLPGRRHVLDDNRLFHWWTINICSWINFILPTQKLCFTSLLCATIIGAYLHLNAAEYYLSLILLPRTRLNLNGIVI